LVVRVGVVEITTHQLGATGRAGVDVEAIHYPKLILFVS
jgi:hypothetical protein